MPGFRLDRLVWFEGAIGFTEAVSTPSSASLPLRMTGERWKETILAPPSPGGSFLTRPSDEGKCTPIFQLCELQAASSETLTGRVPRFFLSSQQSVPTTRTVMSLLPFLPVFLLVFFKLAHARVGHPGADSLLQIQRVLELSSEIAKAEDVSISDISTAESKFTSKRQSYALPNELLVIVKNHLLNLKKQQESRAQGIYATPAPDHQQVSNQIDQDQYRGGQYQDEQSRYLQQYPYGARLPQQQQYDVSGPSQLYTSQQDNTQHYVTPEQQSQQQYESLQQYAQPEQQQNLQDLKSFDVRYNVPSGHGYVTAVNQPIFQQPQIVSYQHPDPTRHYAIAGQQALVAEVAQIPHQLQGAHKAQQHMYFVGGHPQSGSYTEALIPSTPQQFVSPQASDPMNLPKTPVQINIHPQSFGLVNSYKSHPQPDSYMPLQILINHLAEPAKYLQPGISPPGGPDQPKMPIYHYSPVPTGTLKNEAVPEMRIKSTYTPPNPHSDKYKNYPSSPPAPSSLNSLVNVAPQQMSPPSSSAWYSSSSMSSPPQTQPAVTSSSQPDWDDDEFIKYDFGYRVSDQQHKVEFGKTESKKDGVTKGSYHVLLPDGRLQVVKYWSDHTGYHTNISYSVPGVDDKA